MKRYVRKETTLFVVIFTLFTNILSVYILNAQEVIHGKTNSWFSLLNRVELNDKWSFSNELHERTGEILQDQGQFLIRPSIDYHLNNQVEFSLGYTYIHVNPYEPYNLPMPRNENNIWEQTLLKNKIGNVKIIHRFRQEHRWINHIEKTADHTFINGNDFANRFRYRFTTIFDVYSFPKSSQKIFVSVWDEVWIAQSNNLAPKDFNRNWLYIGLGLTINPTTNIQFGFMHQYDKVGANQFISSPILQTTFVKNFTLNKKS